MAETKKLVDLQMWRSDHTSIEAKGRFLGLVTNKQLALMIKERNFSKRVSTVRTMALSELADLDVQDVKDKRMIFVAKEIEEKEVNDPVLLVTDRIDFIANLNGDDVTVNCENNGYLILQEVD